MALANGCPARACCAHWIEPMSLILEALRKSEASSAATARPTLPWSAPPAPAPAWHAHLAMAGTALHGGIAGTGRVVGHPDGRARPYRCGHAIRVATRSPPTPEAPAASALPTMSQPTAPVRAPAPVPAAPTLAPATTPAASMARPDASILPPPPPVATVPSPAPAHQHPPTPHGRLPAMTPPISETPACRRSN